MFSIRKRVLGAPLQQLLTAPLRTGPRALSTSPLRQKEQMMGSNPKANQPDGISAETRKDSPNTDPQSNASQEEHKTGDDHPARQPDYQAKPTRSTGFESQDEVKGGKEGLGDRVDKQKGWDPQHERKRGEGVATD